MRSGTRNTSTSVEKTVISGNDELKRQKHLHERGEDALSSGASIILMETPPRAWRRPVSRPRTGYAHRNTSTSVEKTVLHSLQLHLAEKHLHERGEDRILSAEYGEIKETPPRAWRRPQSPRHLQSPSRNTSTSVEKTQAETVGTAL